MAKAEPLERLTDYATSCGEALALAHARGDRRSSRFEAAMAEQLPAAVDALIAATADYAERVVADRDLLRGLVQP